MTPELLHALTSDELPKYRQRTLALLRRYFHSSIEVGRLPSILGREFFRAKVTSYRVTTFEDAIIFVHDVECSLKRLDRFSQQLIGKIVFQNYSFDEIPRELNCARATVFRRFPEALDELSRTFLRGGLLSAGPLPPCQAPKTEENSVTVCNESK